MADGNTDTKSYCFTVYAPTLYLIIFNILLRNYKNEDDIPEKIHDWRLNIVRKHPKQ